MVSTRASILIDDPIDRVRTLPTATMIGVPLLAMALNHLMHALMPLSHPPPSIPPVAKGSAPTVIRAVTAAIMCRRPTPFLAVGTTVPRINQHQAQLEAPLLRLLPLLLPRQQVRPGYHTIVMAPLRPLRRLAPHDLRCYLNHLRRPPLPLHPLPLPPLAPTVSHAPLPYLRATSLLPRSGFRAMTVTWRPCSSLLQRPHLA